MSTSLPTLPCSISRPTLFCLWGKEDVAVHFTGVVHSSAFALLGVQREDKIEFHKGQSQGVQGSKGVCQFALLRTPWCFFHTGFPLTKEERPLRIVLERLKGMPGDLRAHTFNIF